MGLRPGRAYHHSVGMSYTRTAVRKPRKAYVKGVPVHKIRQFEMGNRKDMDKFNSIFHLISTREMQFRSNCLESARIAITEFAKKKIGVQNYFVKILVYPHQVLREHALATGAGADRFSTGMAKSFGRKIGRAARIKPNQKIITIRAIKEKAEEAHEALKRAAGKLPGCCRVMTDAEFKKL